MAWYEQDKYKECCHNDDCEIFDTCIECWDEWAERNPPMTNADHIRSMSDEELAIFLNRVKKPCDCCHLMDTEGACTETLCDDAMKNWLKAPYKEKEE